VGLAKQSSNHSWRINTYYNYIDDYIFINSADDNGDGIADRGDEEGEFEVDGELLLGIYENETAEFYGIEAEYIQDVYQQDSTSANVRVFGDYVRAEFSDNDLGDVPRISPARLGINLNGQHDLWDGSIDLIYTFEQNKTAELEESTDDFTMLNASVSRTFFAGDSDVRVFVRAENLLDEDARRHSSFTTDQIVLPGRGVRFGLSVDY